MRRLFLLAPVLTMILILSSVAPPTAVLAQGGQDPVSLRLYFNNSAYGQLTPIPVDGENVEQVHMFSTPLIAPPLTIGRWNSKELKMPLSIYGEFSCTLWADSSTGANNAYFEVSILRGSTVVADYNTSRKDISAGAQPTRFDINDILNVELQGGETLGVMVGFDADPLSIISPAQATFYFGGG